MWTLRIKRWQGAGVPTIEERVMLTGSQGRSCGKRGCFATFSIVDSLRPHKHDVFRAQRRRPLVFSSRTSRCRSDAGEVNRPSKIDDCASCLIRQPSGPMSRESATTTSEFPVRRRSRSIHVIEPLQYAYSYPSCSDECAATQTGYWIYRTLDIIREH